MVIHMGWTRRHSNRLVDILKVNSLKINTYLNLIWESEIKRQTILINNLQLHTFNSLD